jgi:hypothetical protein
MAADVVSPMPEVQEFQSVFPVLNREACVATRGNHLLQLRCCD